MKQIKCKRCEHKWIPRVKDPKECPNCKSRDWKDNTNDDERGLEKK